MLESLRTFARSSLLDACFIDAHERGVLLVNGKPRRLLGPGWHPYVPKLSKVLRLDISAGFCAAVPELVAVSRDVEPIITTVGESELGLLRVDGRARTVLSPGRWALWPSREPVSLQKLSIRDVHVAVPDEFRSMLSRTLVQSVNVEYESEALLFVDQRFVERLAPGVHHFSTLGRTIRVQIFPRREQTCVVSQQDIMSKDKVTLRLSAVVRYKIADALVAYSHSENLNELVYTETQLALRHIVAARPLEQLLEQREECGRLLRDALDERLSPKGISVTSAATRDFGVPAAMRALLNRVIEASKQAEANLIHRREETAATRALANTARLLDNNPTLARLKELEAWREIAGKVGTVNLVAAPPGALTAVLTAPGTSNTPAAAMATQESGDAFDE